jgi:hypothetical protein
MRGGRKKGEGSPKQIHKNKPVDQSRKKLFMILIS